MLTSKRVCIVTSSNLASNPRVVKEADALYGAGIDVHVVFVQRGIRLTQAHDQELAVSKPWSSSSVRCSRADNGTVRWALGVLRERASRAVPEWGWRHTVIAEEAEGRTYRSLCRTAMSIPADLYVGHYPEGLAAAALAASRHGALLAFDAEDYHSGEPNPAKQQNRAAFIQRRYLPKCSYVSASSTEIAEAIAASFDVPLPLTLYNAFPWEDRQGLDKLQRDRKGPELSLYWYSQTVGMDRGIQDAIRAAGLLGGKVQIHLRGKVDAGVRDGLTSLARECGLHEQLFFHASVPPSELLSRAAEHDVGLALEQGAVLNRALCATNKLFFYMLAGLAVAATDVPGQRSVLANGSGQAMYPAGDYRALASILEEWRINPDALNRAKASALASARGRWNWEIERDKLLEAVRRALGIPECAAAATTALAPFALRDT